MYCKNCGAQLQEGSNFCTNCGTRLTPVPEERTETQRPETTKGQKVTENIYLGTDGKYHWYYEFKMYRNPTILFTVFKVLGLSFFIVYLFVVSLTACDGGSRVWSEIVEVTVVFAAIMAGVLVLGTISYLILAAINGGKYCVLFEMDENGVTHTQMPKQFKKAEAMSTILILAGVAKGNVGRVGQGMMIRGHQSLSSSWKTVRSVSINRHLNTIKVNELLNKNQVYAEDADFDFVANYIVEHVSEKCKIS